MILDAVVQHYSIEQDARSICVNYKEEYDKAVENLQSDEKDEDEDENKDKDKDELEEKNTNVFANFKT